MADLTANPTVVNPSHEGQVDHGHGHGIMMITITKRRF